MNKNEIVVTKSCSSTIILSYKNCFQDDYVDFRLLIVTLRILILMQKSIELQQIHYEIS